MADWEQAAEQEVDEDLSKDVASLRAVLRESATSSYPKLERLAESRKSVKRGILTIWRTKRGSAYFQDHKGQTPPTLSLRSNERIDQLGTLIYCRGQSWACSRGSRSSDDKLREGVRRQIIDSLTKSLQTSLLRADGCEEKMMLRQQIQDISRRPIAQLVHENVDIDWSILAYEQFNYTHTAIDCELRWRGHAHPALNKGSWRKTEDKQLMKVAEKHSFRDWTAIAKELGTRRSGFLCLQRYQQSLNPTMFAKTFSAEDDDYLREAVSIYGESRWALVSVYVGNKTAAQCLHRWTNSLKPGIKKGRWSEEEDEVLREAVRKCGVGKWTRIATLVPGRTQSQVRERWVNHLDERVSKTSWTQDEDKKLTEICQKYSDKIPWSVVAKEMGSHRTDNMCLARWRIIGDPATIFRQFSKTLKMRETIMTSHFIGRKRCRHSLGEDDIEEIVPEATKEKLRVCEEQQNNAARNGRVSWRRNRSRATERGSETTLASSGTTVADRQTTAAERQTTEADRQTTVANGATTVADRQTTVANRQTAVANRQTTVADRQTTVANGATTVADRQTTVADRQTTVADTVANGATTVADRQTTVAETSGTTVADRQTTVADRQTAVAETSGTTAAAQRQREPISQQSNNRVSSAEPMFPRGNFIIVPGRPHGAATPIQATPLQATHVVSNQSLQGVFSFPSRTPNSTRYQPGISFPYIGPTEQSHSGTRYWNVPMSPLQPGPSVIPTHQGWYNFGTEPRPLNYTHHSGNHGNAASCIGQAMNMLYQESVETMATTPLAGQQHCGQGGL